MESKPYANVGHPETGCEGIDKQARNRMRSWLLARARLMPDLLSQSPPWVRGVFDNSWAPMEAMARQVRCLPGDLWDALLKWDSGFVAICTTDSRYEPGPATIRHQQMQHVAYVSVEDLAEDNDRVLHVFGHLVDHHLGCGGAVNGPWLSEGGGLTSCWQQAGERLPRLFALGYGVDEVAQSNVRDYFAQSLSQYCRNRQRLNVADPQICKWFRTTLWEAGFWEAE
jgi:hypothetical protein